MPSRDERSTGCPIAILTAHVALLGVDSRHAFEQGAASLTSWLGRLMEDAGHPEDGILVISILYEMAGALSMSRVITGQSRSDEVLRICRATVLARALPG